MFRKLRAHIEQFKYFQKQRKHSRRKLLLPEALEPRWTLSASGAVVDLSQNSSSLPFDFTATSLGVFFSASVPGRDRELFISDGTVAGTRLVRDIELAVGATGTSKQFSK